jgi:cell division protease FtsH
MKKKKESVRPSKPTPGEPKWRFSLLYILAAIAMLMMWQKMLVPMAITTIPYSEFKQYVQRKEVTECEIKDEEITGRVVPLIFTPPKGTSGTNATPARVEPKVEAKVESKIEVKPTTNTISNAANSLWDQWFKNPATNEPAVKDTLDKPFFFRTVRVEDPRLVEDLQSAGVRFVGVRPSMLAQIIFAWVLPLGLIVLFWIWISRKTGAAGQSILSFGKSKARLVGDRETGVTFQDVAGCDEAKYELQEVVDFLKNPDRYKALGAKIPKGVLLVGPPGTGKTLLARAVAGEAKVVFFSMSGSDFVEMFVGVGAARVRDLFQQAKSQAPCIIFIDELDAIGRQRGVHFGAVNDEREQTLNQLLVEMDGFEANVGVIILAATNRPDVLDRALLRPGRFDRQVVVDAPDIDGREAILKVHSKGKPLANGVDLRKIAQSTPGFSGADLANALNEAALLAARRKAKSIHQIDMENAVEKVVAGPERKSRRLREEEKRRVGYHEVGHAIVAAYGKFTDPVHKISVVPRGRAALGYTLQLPMDDQFLLTRTDLSERIRGLLGGRAAEEVVFAEVTTGAENDLQRATALARQMVCIYGMSDKVGLTHCGRTNEMAMAYGQDGGQRDCSEDTAREIDKEVNVILSQAYDEAREILSSHRDQLEKVTAELLIKESLDGATFYEMLGLPMPRLKNVTPPILLDTVDEAKASTDGDKESPAPDDTEDEDEDSDKEKKE